MTLVGQIECTTVSLFHSHAGKRTNGRAHKYICTRTKYCQYHSLLLVSSAHKNCWLAQRQRIILFTFDLWLHQSSVSSLFLFHAFNTNVKQFHIMVEMPLFNIRIDRQIDRYTYIVSYCLYLCASIQCKRTVNKACVYRTLYKYYMYAFQVGIIENNETKFNIFVKDTRKNGRKEATKTPKKWKKRMETLFRCFCICLFNYVQWTFESSDNFAVIDIHISLYFTITIEYGISIGWIVIQCNTSIVRVRSEWVSVSSIYEITLNRFSSAFNLSSQFQFDAIIYDFQIDIFLICNISMTFISTYCFIRLALAISSFAWLIPFILFL